MPCVFTRTVQTSIHTANALRSFSINAFKRQNSQPRQVAALHPLPGRRAPPHLSVSTNAYTAAASPFSDEHGLATAPLFDSVHGSAARAAPRPAFPVFPPAPPPAPPAPPAAASRLLPPAERSVPRDARRRGSSSSSFFTTNSTLCTHPARSALCSTTSRRGGRAPRPLFSFAYSKMLYTKQKTMRE